MNYSLIKKVCLISFGGLAFLGLAKWAGVADTAAPVPVVKTEKSQPLNETNQNNLTNNVIALEIKADIEKQLNLKDNVEYQAYQDKLKWISKKSSLRGTQIGGAYPVDGEGHLIAHISIKHRFDYFMTLLGELSYSQLILLIEEDIKQTLQEPARTEALSLLQNYQAYKYALKALDDEFSANQVSLRDRAAIVDRQIALYQSIDLLRYEHFAPDYRLAFFEQEIADEQALIANLQGSGYEEESDDQSKLTGVIATLEQQSLATGEDLFTLQAQAFGIEAAQRLSEVRESRNELTQKVLTYLNDRNTIQTSSLSSELQIQEIENLIESRFTLSEQKRLPALVKMVQ